MNDFLLQAAQNVLGNDDFVLVDDRVRTGYDGPDPVFANASKMKTIKDRATELQAANDAVTDRQKAFPNLEPDQFWFLVRLAGYEQAINDWLVTLAETDPIGYAQISAKLEYAKFFERDHPFIVEAISAIGIEEAELDALWQYATN